MGCMLVIDELIHKHSPPWINQRSIWVAVNNRHRSMVSILIDWAVCSIFIRSESTRIVNGIVSIWIRSRMILELSVRVRSCAIGGSWYTALEAQA